MTVKRAASKGEGRQKKASGYSKVKFQLRAPAESRVYVAGSFNQWDPEATRLRRSRSGLHETIVELPAGRHEYKFVVDGQWQIDGANPLWTPSSMGSLNSMIDVAAD